MPKCPIFWDWSYHLVELISRKFCKNSTTNWSPARCVAPSSCCTMRAMSPSHKWWRARSFRVDVESKLTWHGSITPPKINGWNLEMMVSNRNLLFQGSIFRFHVCFGGCNNRGWSLINPSPDRGFMRAQLKEGFPSLKVGWVYPQGPRSWGRPWLKWCQWEIIFPSEESKSNTNQIPGIALFLIHNNLRWCRILPSLSCWGFPS